MSTILVACSMLEDEINLIMQQECLTYPVIWLERGLHQWPRKLHIRLQELIFSLEKEYDTILLGYCQCGGILQGLHSFHAVLAAMNCDDCVRMLLPNGTDCRSLYFTAGWIRSDGFIGKEYSEVQKKYGLQKAERIYKRMLQQYTSLTMVETGSYDLVQYRREAVETAARLHLQYKEVQGSVSVLRKLLTFQWDCNICVL